MVENATPTEHPEALTMARRTPGKGRRNVQHCEASVLTLVLLLCWLSAPIERDVFAHDFPQAATGFFQEYCNDCHTGTEAEAHLDLSQRVANPSFLSEFPTWERVARALELRQMPPADAAQPPDDLRSSIARQLRGAVQAEARRYAGDPGPVVVRRLTAAEYGYTIADITRTELDLRDDLPGDAVGGAGFANLGTVQFTDMGTLERYLAAAKKVAAHAVVGAGPLRFYRAPGLTGQELSAIDRIMRIYRTHGFRTGAGEGAQPYGLDSYPRAFCAAWRYRHRETLGVPDWTLAQCAADEQVSDRFVAHIWRVLHTESTSAPIQDIVARWHALPAPRTSDRAEVAAARRQCDALYEQLRGWQQRLAGGAGQQEEAAILSEDRVQAGVKQLFQVLVIVPSGRRKWPLTFVTAPVNRYGSATPRIAWSDGRVRFRNPDKRWEDWEPLASRLSEPADGPTSPTDQKTPRFLDNTLIMEGQATRTFDMNLSAGTTAIELEVRAELQPAGGDGGVVRCEIREPGYMNAGTTVSALLSDPSAPSYAAWTGDVREFARQLPQVSHREAAPSDRDAIPAPFDNTYNAPERDLFHIRLKYHRDDRFLVEHILDDDTRRQLDQAWADLLGSFDYYDIFLRFVADKFGRELGERTMATVDRDWIEGLPEGAAEPVRRLRREYEAVHGAFRQAEAGHLADVEQFAARAWRRSLTSGECVGLRSFYERLREHERLTHTDAVRALVARVLTSPAFLYRVEQTEVEHGRVRLSDRDLAHRLSYLLWSSVPDGELLQAAKDHRLNSDAELARQVRRMLQDPKARRLASEFFGQWFGFYQFDRYRGVDPTRFPEFSDSVRQSLLREAELFFEHLVRNEAPLSDILFADYTFLNADLAKYYGLEVDAAELPGRVSGLADVDRGGLLGLGAVLTITSAPLRTSPVKRGDWILRRVLGTPVPPPPADAGSIPADDVLADGRTIKERLDAHRHSATCANCHMRIDPLGMALEHFDPLGRWRATYRDGHAIDAAGELADGRRLAGAAGLRRHLREHQSLFYRNLARRWLGYSLGRSELASDAPLIEALVAAMADGQGTFTDSVLVLVRSPQFQYRRGRDDLPVESLSPKEPDDAN
ncbi:MAG: DUF1592 domain-containing protein [Pirellulaceae bacterium]